MVHPQANQRELSGPYFRGLNDDQCRQIHNASLEILERTGVLINYQPALNLLKKTGCIIEENRVRVPEHLVSWALSAAPSRIMIYDRTGKPVMPLEGRISTFGTGSDCLNILDHRTGKRRKATLQDIIDGIRVSDSLPHIDFIMSMFLPQDVPVYADVHQMELMLTYSSKPICFVTYDWAGTEEIVEMLEVVTGGKEQLQINPTAILYLNPTTAFNHNQEALRKLIFAAEKRLPVVYLPDVQRGFTCPITSAGAMACANAGQLVGLLIAQLVNEGTPVILNAATPSTIDMKTLVLPYVEPAGKAFSLEMNFYYNLPAFSTGGCSDSKLLDEQAITEAALSLFSAAIRGGNMIHDLGYLESGLTGSLELTVICDEIISWLKYFHKGLEITEETLALDLVHEYALKGDFLGTEHTVRHVREGWQPGLVDRRNFEQWMADSGSSMRERAREKIDEILCEEPTEFLPPDIKRRVRTITEKIIKKG